MTDLAPIPTEPEQMRRWARAVWRNRHVWINVVSGPDIIMMAARLLDEKHVWAAGRYIHEMIPGHHLGREHRGFVPEDQKPIPPCS